MSFFARANRRHLLRQPLQVVLSVTGIALGVAVVLAVDLANHSALRAFGLADRAVSGDATDTIVPASSGIDERFYRDLRIKYGFRHSAPEVTGTVHTPDGRTLRVLGIDPLAAPSVSGNERPPAKGISPGKLIAGGDAVLLTPETARSLGMSKGGVLKVTTGNRSYQLKLVGLLGGDGPRLEGLRGMLVTDISTAQVLLKASGTLSRIDLVLDAKDRKRLVSILPPSLELRPSRSRSHAMAQMTQAFQTNLTALGLLALLIGAFLIYNTQTLFVLNRRESFALWRTLGITRGQVMRQVMLEAVWLTLAGALLGCLAGLELSRVLLSLVTRTINDLYFSLELGGVSVSPLDIVKACSLGLVASLAATALPALEASRVQPRLALSRSELERGARRLRGTGAVLAILMWLSAAAILALSQRSVTAGFVALFFTVFGFALMVPGGLRLLTRGAVPLLERSFGWMGVWSARNVLASMSRTQIAVTALTVALAATIGVSVMIESFRGTVAQWLDSYLRADIYISRPGGQTSETGIDPALLQRLRQVPGVEAVSTGRWRLLPTPGEPTHLFVLDENARGFQNFHLLNRTNLEVWPEFSGGAVIVSESYAYHRRLHAGDSLTLPTANGPRSFDIADLFYDYSSDRGRVIMHRRTYDRYWNDPAFESMAVYLQPGIDSEAFLDRIEKTELAGTGLTARSNAKIKTASLRIFDRTFTVTEVLRLLTMVVAAIGILSALIAIQLDRTREFAVLRACGLTQGEMFRVMTIEGGLMGAVSAILSIPLGLVLAGVLIFVINKRSFGWSMQFSPSWEQAATAMVLGVAAGVAAAVYPAWRMNRQLLISNLRYE
jgi:putative ABC transport system permease protein